MSIKQCACLSLLLILSLSRLPLAQGGQMAILRVVLNQEEKGDFFIHITEDGDFLIRVEDLKKIGLPEARGRISVIEGEEFCSLRSIKGLAFELNEKKLSLEIQAEPGLFGKKILTMRYPKYPKIYYPKDTAGFLNYNLVYSAGDHLRYEQTLLSNQLGFRTGDFLLLTDSSYSQKKGEGADFVRLMSNITYDRREDLLRGVLGDFFATSGDLGSTLNMGGLSFSKNYLIDPYLIKYPEVSFSGLISLPSEVEVYRDGVLIKKERISPGEFILRDIPAYVGTGIIEVVLRDPFGREQRIRQPYYFTDRLLKKGLHEFSYTIGFQRRNFGVASDEYGDLTFLGFHRYGISDDLTAGIRGESSEEVINLGLSSTLLILKRFGVIDASLAWSGSKGGEDGLAGMVGYLYQGHDLSFNFLLKGFTRNYSNISLANTIERTKYEVSTGAGYHSPLLGSLSLSFSAMRRYQGTDTKNILASYSRNITNHSTVSATFKRDLEARTSEFLISFNYYFKHGITASASHQRTDGTYSERIQVLKNLPPGEGFGGRASFDRNYGDIEKHNDYGLQLQYNARYGQYGGEVISSDHRERYSFSAGGGVSFVKDSLNFSRPIQDSFALVKVGDLKGVRVYLNNQEVGRTGSSGRVLIPNLGSYYDSQISISDKDVPMEYTFAEVMRYVSPPLRSGSYIEFSATKIQGFTGMLKVRVEGEIKPVEYIEFKLFVEGKEWLSPTGKGGEFYLENIKPGRYSGEFNYLEKQYVFDIMIPKTEEVIVNLGEIICE